MKTTAIYCRVSTEGQEREGTSLQTQLEHCLKYCHDKGYEVRYQFSEAYSGLSLDRPKLNELRDIVRAECVDVLMVYCLDRISRDPNHGVILQEELERHHVTLEAVTETVESTDLGKLISYIRQYAGKLEVDKIKDRLARAKRAMLSAGKWPQGWGVGIYGYDWNPEAKQNVPNEYEVLIVERIFTLIADGLTRAEVARQLNDQGIKTKRGHGESWHRATVERIITNKAYIGINTYHGVELTNTTPAILARELFDRANHVLKHTKALRKGRPKNPYLLTGYIVCGKCGHPLAGSCTRLPYRYYHCSQTYGREYRAKACDGRRIRADGIETAVWGEIEKVLKNPKLILQQATQLVKSEREQLGEGTLDKEIARYEGKIKKHDIGEKNLISLLRHNQATPDIVLDELNQLKQECEADKIKLAELTETRDNIRRLANAEIRISEYCGNVVPNLADFTFEDKRLALEALGVTITATPEHYHIAMEPAVEIELPAMSANAQSCPSLRVGNHIQLHYITSVTPKV